MGRTIKSLSIVAAAGLLHGCVIAPGMTMSEPAEIDADTVVQVQSITPALLDQLDAERQNSVREIAREFSELPGPYRIGQGDVLQVTVWDHPELTIPAGSFRDAETSGQLVGDDGTIFYPYVGIIEVEGMTIAALRDVLTERISRYIQDPQLDVRVVAFRSHRVNVVGEVESPGVLPISDIPMTVSDAISLAGGLTENGFKSGVNISRAGTVYEIDLKALYDYADSSQNLLLRHGDIVNVLDLSQQKVFVMGEVNRPGSVTILNGRLSLAAAIGEVGGVRQTSADPSGIYVIRGSSEETPKIFHLDAGFATGMLLADRFEMRAQDVVFVDTAGVSQWNRVISQLLPSISVIGIVDNVTQ